MTVNAPAESRFLILITTSTYRASAYLDAGDRLEVLLKKGEPLDNVPKSATEQGYKVHEILEVEGDVFKVVIEK